jgi:hypothetical protein
MFTTPSTLEKWFPAIIRHPFIFLSSICLVSTWLDMQHGSWGDSPRTTMVKDETYAMINNQMQDTEMAGDETTIMGVLHILVGDMWDVCEKTLDSHVQGVATLFTNRGGLNQISSQNQTLAEVAIRCALGALSIATMFLC